MGWLMAVAAITDVVRHAMGSLSRPTRPLDRERKDRDGVVLSLKRRLNPIETPVETVGRPAAHARTSLAPILPKRVGGPMPGGPC